MEPHQQMNEVDGGAGKSGGFLCRQSSSRWTPTTDQIRILKDLYYNNGVRSPSAEQIQRISARLRQYGKIEGKNVFYWFQNHKARERQKKRFTSDNHHHHHPPPIFAANPPGASGPSSSSSSVATAGHHVYTVGQGSSYAYGTHLMDKQSFIREGPILSGGGGWVGHYMDPYSSSFFDKRKVLMEENQEDQEEEEEEEVEEEAPEIETLPLFPMYAEDIKMNCSGGGWYRNSSAGNAASLELTLNSYSSYYNGKLPD